MVARNRAQLDDINCYLHRLLELSSVRNRNTGNPSTDNDDFDLLRDLRSRAMGVKVVKLTSPV